MTTSYAEVDLPRPDLRHRVNDACFLETGGNEQVAVPRTMRRPDRHDGPEHRKAGNQDAARDGEEREMSDVRQGKRRKRIDRKREDESPPAKIERQTLVQVASRLQDS